MELKNAPLKLAPPVSGQNIGIVVTVTNNSKKDVKDGNVALKDEKTDDTGAAFFGYIGIGKSDSRTVDLKGPFEFVMAHFNAHDETGWTGWKRYEDADHLEIKLYDDKVDV